MNYITTYEALCVQLLDEGKTYKEIASILSVAPSTVKMHLKRLRARTGLTIQELILHSFHAPNNDSSNLDKDSTPTWGSVREAAVKCKVKN